MPPSSRSSLRRLFEIFQIRRRLVLPGGHQEALRAEHVVLIRNGDMIVGLAAILLAPCGIGIGTTPVVLRDRPGTRQRVVDHGDLVMGNIGVILVDVYPFLDDGLIVGMQRKAAGVERTWTSEAARLHFENIVAAIAVRIDPLARGIAEE